MHVCKKVFGLFLRFGSLECKIVFILVNRISSAFVDKGVIIFLKLGQLSTFECESVVFFVRRE